MVDLGQEFQVVQVDLIKHDDVEVRVVKPIHPNIFRDTATEEGVNGYAHDTVAEVVFAKFVSRTYEQHIIAEVFEAFAGMALTATRKFSFKNHATVLDELIADGIRIILVGHFQAIDNQDFTSTS